AQVAARLRYHGSLAGAVSVGEVDHDPIARLVETVSQRRVGIESAEAPAVVRRLVKRQPRFVGRIEPAWCNCWQQATRGLIPIGLVHVQNIRHSRLSFNGFGEAEAAQSPGERVDQSAQPFWADAERI